MTLYRSLGGIAAGALAASIAFAQAAPAPGSPAPAASSPPAASTPVAESPKHNCTKPAEYPGRLASETQRRTWQKELVGYTDCLKKFITDQKAIAEPHVNAYNAAVDEYNQSVKAFNDQIEKAKQ